MGRAEELANDWLPQPAHGAVRRRKHRRVTALPAPPGLLIVADDLSGAADCSLACVESGLHALVVLDSMAEPPLADVLAIDADTRRLSVTQAAARTSETLRRHARHGQSFFKKLDSTLRGHVGAEIAAALRVLHKVTGRRHLAVVAPAFPAAARTTRGGRQHVAGQPLEATDIWRQEGLPGPADLPLMLGRHGVDVLHTPAHEVAAALAATLNSRDGIVCDAETDADLMAIAHAAIETSSALGVDLLWVGSAGLAQHMPAALQLMARHPQPIRPTATDSPIAVVVGSLSQVAAVQVAALAGDGDVTLLSIPLAALLGADSAVWQNRLAAGLSRGDVVLTLAPTASVDWTHAVALSASLARLLQPHRDRLGGLVVTGGETARAVLTSFGGTALHLVCAIEPGVPLSVLEGGRAGLPVITKAGAFGSPQTLVRCRHALREGWRPAVA